MARPLRITYPGAFCHITSRGNERKTIFKSRADRRKFLAYLESATERYSAVIHGYCLMGNHYHKRSGTPLKAIGERYGLGDSDVSRVSRRLEKRKTEDAALKQVVAKIDRAIQSQESRPDLD